MMIDDKYGDVATLCQCFSILPNLARIKPESLLAYSEVKFHHRKCWQQKEETFTTVHGSLKAGNTLIASSRPAVSICPETVE